MHALALIAEDEPLLADALSRMLLRHWPDLVLLPTAPDGQAAIETALAELPAILFLDIQMPDINGLDAAEMILEGWPDHRAPPLIVFVTAYDQYALAAFEHAAADYILKPVQSARLQATIERLHKRLETPSAEAASVAPPTEAPPEPLTILQVASGHSLLMVPVDEVLSFEAADKYVRVVTDRSAGQELLIRTPLRELLPRLDPLRFWQIHRSAVVNVRAIERVIRDGSRLRIHIRGRTDTLEVSRMYAHRFKAM